MKHGTANNNGKQLFFLTPEIANDIIIPQPMEATRTLASPESTLPIINSVHFTENSGCILDNKHAETMTPMELNTSI